MGDVFRTAAQLVKHVLKAPHVRFVGAGFLGRDDRVEGGAELLHVRHDEVLHGVRQDDQRYLLRNPGQTCRDVGMWTPCVDLFIDALGILRPKYNTVALARALYRIMHHLEVRLPRAKNLVQAIG